MSAKWYVISLGGSVIAPDVGAINLTFINQCVAFLAHLYEKERGCSAIITGGGAIARCYQAALREGNVAHDGSSLSSLLDKIGIAATRLHAELVGAICARTHPTTVIRSRLDKNEVISVNTPFLVSGGWKEGVSTDYIATTIAHYLGAREVLNISDTPYIYDRDPRIDAYAIPQRSLSWQEYRAIIGSAWQPGGHVPFDPHASAFAERHHLAVRFVAPNMEEVEKVFLKQQYNGSTIS